ncbi:MAG: ABC transporter ATP-binding protein, partial [Bacteroidetes bacterium]|nr:ABC transporter ATP-binding protein [Bacteroidota bacterium]
MNPSTRPPGDGRRALVQLRNLTKTYQEGEQERAVLRQLNADIHDGEFVVLMGRSGAG